MTKILNGEIVRDKIGQELKNQIAKLKTRPKLVIVQVGEIAESTLYISRKNKFGEEIGAIVDHQQFDAKIDQKTLSSQISSLNTDPKVNGIIVQLPLPKHLDAEAIIESIDPKKDVDGLTSANFKKLIDGSNDSLIPATTKGILTLLDYYKIPTEGKKVTVVGRSSLVGKPTALAFLNRNATVTVCHSRTKNLADITKGADILISAVGHPGLITTDHVNSNQVVIDVGTTLVNGKLKGDFDFENVAKIVKAISPVPGGIGPMTVVSLFENLLIAYELQAKFDH